jgi:hypothetical protein
MLYPMILIASESVFLQHSLSPVDDSAAKSVSRAVRIQQLPAAVVLI